MFVFFKDIGIVLFRGESKIKESRIYRKIAKIDDYDSKCFWNNRANKYDENNPYVTIKLGDNNPERARRWDEYEKNYVLPLLNITSKDVVLDIGCGIGRLSEEIIPKCKFYLGVDYADKLIEIAKKRISCSYQNYMFMQAAMQDISENNKMIPLCEGKYSIVIIEGVLPFVNDDNIQQCLRNILTVLADTCKIFIANPVGIACRLTLDKFYSDELNADYSIIYRTEQQYMEYFAYLLMNGFHLSRCEDFLIETGNNNETKRVFYIFERV